MAHTDAIRRQRAIEMTRSTSILLMSGIPFLYRPHMTRASNSSKRWFEMDVNMPFAHQGPCWLMSERTYGRRSPRGVKSRISGGSVSVASSGAPMPRPGER